MFLKISNKGLCFIVFALYKFCWLLLAICYLCLAVWYGINKDIDAYINHRCEMLIISKAEEIATLNTQENVEMLARKYTDRLLEQQPIFAQNGEAVKGNAMPQFLTEEGQYIEHCMIVEATAYWTHDPIEASGDGIAFDGTPAIAYKTLAVDSKVIPLGAEVYVPTIGWCRANDTGNAIKGRIIDVPMPSRTEAWQWGRRLVQVKIRTQRKQAVLCEEN